MKNETTAALSHDATVNEIIREHPETVEVFNRHGIDACCGGAVPVREAATRDGADPDTLWSELEAAVEGTS